MRISVGAPILTLRRLEIGNAVVDIRFWREGDRTRWDASVQVGEIDFRTNLGNHERLRKL